LPGALDPQKIQTKTEVDFQAKCYIYLKKAGPKGNSVFYEQLLPRKLSCKWIGLNF